MIEKLELEQNPLSETVEKIREICPAAVTRDGKIDFEELKTSLATDVAEDTIEKYEFTWVGKNAAKAEANRPIRKTLRPVVADSKDWDNTKNLYIEGDNLDALKLLQESYLGKVKMIYIDPPYNTGNDFVYCDNFKMGCAEFIEKSGQCDADGNRLFANTKTNGRFHSDWCSMMYPRLKIARNLLTDDGVIFISIDDNEIANLKKICDEIFGEDNLVGIFIWEKTFRPTNLSKKTRKNSEFILSYANKADIELSGQLSDTQGDFSLTKKHNKAQILILPANIVNANFEDGTYGKGDYGSGYELLDDIQVLKGKVVNSFRIKVAASIWGQSYLDEEIQNGVLLTLKNKKTMVLYARKVYQQTELKPTTLLPGDIVEDVLASTAELKNLFGKVCFDYPKPTKLIQYLLNTVVENKNALVLDFFSGSATAAQAVMQLNAEDDGNRKFIMVQLPENLDENLKHATGPEKVTIQNAIALCDELKKTHLLTEVAKERIRRAGEKIKAENPDKDLDVGFRVLRVDSDNMADIAKRPSDITQGQLKLDVENIVPERSDLDLLFGVMVDCGLMLDMPIETKQMDDKTYYVVNHGDLVACFEKNIPEKLIYEIARMNPVCAVFRDSSFAEPKDKINLTEIFKNITGNDKCVKVL